MNVKDDWL